MPKLYIWIKNPGDAISNSPIESYKRAPCLFRKVVLVRNARISFKGSTRFAFSRFFMISKENIGKKYFK
ncbi:hypothetical protein BpHYR1_036176 [Brachionus plicatilis]|uniref:Uncharacterized protein n=1 Tax=Brachionus plicatilis TaxID=10195 RepID=A0A3M7QIE1_BRAPC|nr:hypothetical protein BpHYR1_036176 [Brachionus plicatilis]